MVLSQWEQGQSPRMDAQASHGPPLICRPAVGSAPYAIILSEKKCGSEDLPMSPSWGRSKATVFRTSASWGSFPEFLG